MFTENQSIRRLSSDSTKDSAANVAGATGRRTGQETTGILVIYGAWNLNPIVNTGAVDIGRCCRCGQEESVSSRPDSSAHPVTDATEALQFQI